MVRSSVIIALVLAAAVAVASAQPPAPAFSMVFNKPTKGARPLPGTLNGAEMTYMQVMLRIVFEGQLTIGNPAADPAAREALLAAALTVVADASAAAQAVAGSDPFAGWELTLRPPVMYQNNEGEKELMLIGKLYRDDGSDFPKEAEDALRAPFDYYASTKMNLANDATNNIGMSGVYIKEDNGMAAAYVLDYVHEGEPMPRPPTARALFDGKLISNSAVDLAMLQNVMPLVLSGCLTPLDLGLNPTNFYLLGGISYPSDEGMVTLFRASIELRTENYRDVAMGLYMALEMCVANQLGGATGGAMAWASAPLPSAFVGESRYGNKDDGGTVAFYLEQTQEQYDEVLDNFEVMYVAAQQALNAVLEWGVMSQNRDPYGARANISNFDIGAHGHFMFPDGPRSGFLLRASGMRNVDFPETSDMLWQVMGNAITEFLGMVDMIEGEAHVAPFGMTDEEQYRNDNNNNNGGDNEDDPFVALLVSLEITAATGTENTWKWAETRAKAAVIFYLINSLEDTDGDMGRNVEVGTDIQITTLDMMTFTYSTYIRASSKEVAEAIRENINDNADALEGLLGGGHTASVRSVRGLGRSYQMDGRPSHHGLNRLVGVLGFSGLKVQHADTDVFNGALAEAIAMSTESPKDNAAVVGCVGTDKNEFVCQIELAVPSAPTTTAEYMAMLSMFGDLPAAVETIMQPIWGSEFSVTAECEHCMAAFRPAWFDDDNLKLEFRYWDNFRVNGMDMRGNAGAGNLRTLYGLALLKSLEEATGEEFGLGNFVLEDGNDGARVQFSDLEDNKRNAIESNYGEIANLIAKYLKAWGGLDVSPRFDNGGGNGGNDNCIPHVFRYDRGDGSMVQVATNNCYSMFPSDQCDNANTIDDGRGNTYWLMGSWDNYANLQVCN